METAITNYSIPVRIRKPSWPKKSRTSVTFQTETRRERILRRTKTAAYYFGLVSLLLLLVGTFAFFYFYNHYSAIVTQRINSGFWHSRAGIYAGSIKLRKGQNLSQGKVVELLRRAGYVEGTSAEAIWNGSFTQKESAIEIRANTYM